ncbi:MAG: PQQ-binding-like beta-propeller repeat protein [candidate division Zixibacteria bacterium]|nr:PQQ-binding-like beta-propeller repeat protein [candidate division Zixibacteria bacterium]
MRQVYLLLIILTLMLALSAFADTPRDTRLEQIIEPISIDAPASRAMCTMYKTTGTMYGNWSGWLAGDNVVTYFDPYVMCGDPGYPFEITSFSFALYDYNPGTVVWPADIDIVVYDNNGSKCNGPGAELCRFTIIADEATYSSAFGTAIFPTPCSVSGPFFIGVEYNSGVYYTIPSLIFDDNTTPDTCDNFFSYGGSTYEWYDFWGNQGYPMFIVNGNGAFEGLSLDHVDGFSAPDQIESNTPINFHIRATYQPGNGSYVGAFSNGFRVYSPDGATWQPLTWDTANIGWSNRFDLGFWVGEHSVNGSGADTIGFSASVMFSTIGFEDGFDEEVWTISTQVDESQIGKTLCIDSCFYPPSGSWLWAFVGGGGYPPPWSGPHCFTIVEPTPHWPTRNHDYARTGRSELALGDAECDLTLNWSFVHPSYGTGLSAGPAVYGDKVVCNFTYEYKVFDLDGNELYTLSGSPEIGGMLRCIPTITPITGYPDPVMFVAGGDYASVAAYNFSTGALIWSRDVTTTPSELYGYVRYGVFTVLSIGGTDYVFWTTDDGYVVGADALTGSKIPAFPVSLGYPITVSLATDGVSLFTATNASGYYGDVYSIDPTDGTINWQLSSAGGLQGTTEYGGSVSSELFSGGISYDSNLDVLYVNSEVNGDYPADGLFYRINASNGQLAGPVTQAHRVKYTTPIIGENRVYVSSLSRWASSPLSGHLYAINKTTGDVEWTSSSYSGGAFYGEGILTTETSGPNKLLIFDDDGFLSCYQADDGTELFRRRISFGGFPSNMGLSGAIAEDSYGDLHVLFAAYWGALFDLTIQSDRPRLEIQNYHPAIKVLYDPDENGIVTFPNVFTNTGCDLLTFSSVTGDENTGYVNIPEEPSSGKSRFSVEQDGEINEFTVSVRSSQSDSYGSRGVPPYLESIDLPLASSTISPGDSMDLILDLDTSLIPDDDTVKFYITLCSDDPDFFLNNPSLCPEIEVILDNTCCVTRGNVDNEVESTFEITVTDLVYLMQYIFYEGSPQPPCLEQADCNTDGNINISDLQFLSHRLFRGGPLPVGCDETETLTPDFEGNVIVELNGGSGVANIGDTNVLEIQLLNPSDDLSGFTINLQIGIATNYVFDPTHGSGSYDYINALLPSPTSYFDFLFRGLEAIDNSSPDSIMVGGATMMMGSGLPAGNAEHIYTLKFYIPEGEAPTSGGVCITPIFYPEAATWTFSDETGTHGTPPDFMGQAPDTEIEPGFAPLCFDIVQPVGACCDRNGGCSIETQADCEALDHLYIGDGTTCDPNPCSPVGACCREDDGQCLQRTEWYCVDVLGRVYAGDGEPCEPNPCDCCNGDGMRGNVDGDIDDEINIADLTYLVAYLFTGGSEPPCEEESDIDGNGEINIGDLTHLVAYLFTGGIPPVACP